MRVLLLTLGTRGDVQPFLALGKGLQRAGHDVTICASSSFAPWITGHGLGYAHLNNDVADLVSSEAGQRACERWPPRRTSDRPALRRRQSVVPICRLRGH